MTHDLELLLHLAEDAGIPIPEEIRVAGALTPYEVETRYPGFQGEISTSELNEAIRIAELVFDWAQREIRWSDNPPE